MNKISLFIRDSYKEMMQKVTWPNLGAITTIYYDCSAATIIITALVALMDFASNGVLKFIYSLFK